MTPRAYQAKSIEHLSALFQKRHGLVDASDCGTGKTLVATEVFKRLNLPTVVVCPKQVIPGWDRTATAQGTEFSVINWEMVRTGRTPFGGWRKLSPHDRKQRFVWSDEVGAVIFDEAHRAAGYKSQQSDLMRAARRQGLHSLALSATFAEDPMDLDALGYLIGLHDSDEKAEPVTLAHCISGNLPPRKLSFWQWARRNGCAPGPFNPMMFMGTKEEKVARMAKINAQVFPERGTRVRIAELGDAFPQTQITAELFKLPDGDTRRVNAAYKRIEPLIEKLCHQIDHEDVYSPLLEATRERQMIELMKVPLLAELHQDNLAGGRSTIFFVNFRATVQALCAELGTDCFIDGSQIGAGGASRRESNRMHFQRGDDRAIVVVSDAGGTGLDLHDEFDNYPRSVEICPGHNGKLTMQLLGRARREGSRSKSLQRFVLAAGTPEEKIYSKLSQKLDRIAAFNEGAITDEDLLT